MAITILRYAYRNKPKIPKDNELPISKIESKHFKDGWLDSEKYLPENYELVSLKTDFLSKSVPGWRSCSSWCGLNVKKGTPYRYWKFMKETE